MNSSPLKLRLEKSIITITTDFGEHFPTGQMHGVAYQINPNAKVISITDHVKHFNILEGSFCLLQVSNFFPQDSIHVAVIDPGVGSSRKCIVVKTKKAYFVGPDNGIFYPAIKRQEFEWAYAIDDDCFPKKSNTFHGRDIFVRLASMMTAGIDLVDYGQTVKEDDLVSLNYKKGEVLHIDGFGNIKFNHPALEIKPGQKIILKVGEDQIEATYGKTLSDVSIGKWVVYVGSHNILELAINQNSAASQLLGCRIGSIVEIDS